jgi:hypothetical protein
MNYIWVFRPTQKQQLYLLLLSFDLFITKLTQTSALTINYFKRAGGEYYKYDVQSNRIDEWQFTGWRGSGFCIL